MKIIQLVYSLSSGGAEKFVADLSNQLVRNGHNVIICMLLSDEVDKFIFNKPFLLPNVKFHSMKFNSGISFTKIRQVENFILQEKPDIVHCHLNVIPYIFRLSLLKKNITFFHTLHNIAEYASGNTNQKLINRFFYKYNIIRPICISRLCYESYKTYYKLSNACYIDNGRSQIEGSNAISAVKNEINTYLHSEKSKVFIHVARFNKQKNQKLLIDAFNRLYEENFDFILLIIGNGFQTEEAKFLKTIACPSIHFLGEKNNVNDYLLCSNAFCLSSNYEGLPISLLEALSCGLTPICTPVGGIPDVISNGVNGYLSQELTVDSYVHAIKCYIQRPISKEVLIPFFNEKFSIEVCAKRYEKLYISK